MELLFDYRMSIGFDGMASRHAFTLRFVPMDTLRQRIGRCVWAVDPSVPLSSSVDSEGNTVLSGTVQRPHSRFSACVSGEVSTVSADSDSPVSEHSADPLDAMMYRHFTPKTEPGPVIRSIAGGLDGRSIETAMDAMHAVHDSIRYMKGSTSPQTTAEEAVSAGEGVCQDYAQAMASVCILAGLPARYVVGYTVGEGESHAWTEALVDGMWYGFDPTADRPVGPSHIKVSHGRDFDDCRINRGVFVGAAISGQTVSVTVTEARP